MRRLMVARGRGGPVRGLGSGMDLVHRIRWANVARAAALAAAVLLVVAWPRLRAEPPALPPEPRVEETRATAPPPAEFALEAPREREKPRKRGGEKRRSTRKRRAAGRPAK